MAQDQIKRHQASHKPKRSSDNQRQMVKSNASIPQIDLVNCSMSASLSTVHLPPPRGVHHALDCSSSVVLQTGQPMLSLANRVCHFICSSCLLSRRRDLVSRCLPRALGGPAYRKQVAVSDISLATHRHWVRLSLLVRLLSLFCGYLSAAVCCCLLCVFRECLGFF